MSDASIMPNKRSFAYRTHLTYFQLSPMEDFNFCIAYESTGEIIGYHCVSAWKFCAVLLTCL